jgi:hypothetical protein
MMVINYRSYSMCFHRKIVFPQKKVGRADLVDFRTLSIFSRYNPE